MLIADVAERGDGIFLTPATYFIPPEQIGEYQAKIIEAFGLGRFGAGELVGEKGAAAVGH